MSRSAVLVLAGAVSAAAVAGEVYVDSEAVAGGDGSPERPYTTIQDAINAPGTSAGYTILVRPGVYAQGGRSYGSSYTQNNRVYIDKTLHLKSTGGKDVTHIVGDADTACIMADAKNIVIEGFTLRDGTGLAASGAAGGISAGGSGYTTNRFTIVDCVVSNCVGKTGAISSGVAIRCRMSRNSPSGYGTVTGTSMYNCIVENQTSGYYAACNCGPLVNCTIVNNVVTKQPVYNASATDDGGGHVYDCVIYGNSAAFSDSVGIYENCVADGTAAGVTSIDRSSPYINLYMSAVTGDFRPVAGGVLDGEGSVSHFREDVFPAKYRDYDFDGNATDGRSVPIGVIVDPATPADVGVAADANIRFKFNGHDAAYGYHVHYADYYPSSLYLAPVDSITNSLAAISINAYGSIAIPFHHWLGVRKGVWITPPPAGAKSANGADLGPVPVYGQSVSKHFYVDCNLESYADHDGSSWSSAFKTIQEAVAAASGYASWIHVRAGDYGEGGGNDTSIVDGDARVVANTGSYATLISSEGDIENTIIRGAFGTGSYNGGSGACRCLVLKGSKLGVAGFTLAGGACSGSDANANGGGVYAADSNVVVSDCVITNCRGYLCSAAYRGTLVRCRVEGSMSRICPTRNGYSVACIYRGNYSNPTACHAAYSEQTCVNCTIYDPNATESVQVNNSNTEFINCAFAAGGYLVATAGVAFDGNVAQTSGLKKVDAAVEPNLASGDLLLTNPANGDFRPFETSPCIGAGVLSSSVRPYEWTSRYIGLDFSNNSVVLPGGKVVAGAMADVRKAVTYYVDASANDDSGDGLSEATAKHSLAGAMTTLDLLYGDEVVALPGTYNEASQLHGFTAIGSSTSTIRSRVVVPAGVTLRSRDGAATTIIEGADATSADDYGRGSDAIRGAAVEAGGRLVGFTIRSGRTAAADDNYIDDQTGGGVLGESWLTSVVEDCVITDNVSSCGGGVSHVLCRRCRFLGNIAPRFAPAARYASLYNCLFSGNRGVRTTEVLYDCVNCTYCDNYALDGVAATSTFQNMSDCANLANVLVCGTVVTVNSSQGNAMNARRIRNCIFPREMGVVPGATWPSDTNGVNTAYSLAELREMFTDGYPVGSEVATVDAGYDISDAGETDVVGEARVQNGAIDIGAYEYDWKPDYGLALGRRVVVADASAVVESDGVVTLSDGGELVAVWSMSPDGSAPSCMCAIPATISGDGTLYVYLNGADEPAGTLTASGSVRFDNENAVNHIVIRYSGTGSATLAKFRRETGSVIILW